MTRGSSSQVGLFSTQISEQIVRLRALSQGQDGPSEAHQVDLRRAVMATRLLAGSARILQLEVLQQFLDELLEWLQRMERSRQALNTTQALILESVVELEESLMLHLDEIGQESGADLSPFQSQVDELLTLIRHNTQTIDGGADAAALEDEPVEDTRVVPETPSGVESLTALVAGFESEIEAAGTAEALEEIDDRLAPIVARLKDLRLRLRTRHDGLLPGLEPGPFADGLVPIADPASDPVFGAAVARLREGVEASGRSVHVEAFGDSAAIAPGLCPSVATILDHLARDVVAAVEAAGDDQAPGMLRVSLALRIEDGRARVEIADDGPRVQNAGMVGDPDRLSVLAGLRSARVLLEQVQGIIRVEPGDDAHTRFDLSLPVDPDRPHYRVLELEDTSVAVPASLVEQTVEAGGLLYEADESGESVELRGRSVPLADLAQFVEAVVPARGPSPRIAVIGSVEKRVGIGCEAARGLVETDELLDPPSGWNGVAYGAIDTGETVAPVLDVKRLLTLRFRPGDLLDLPGALADPHLDSFVPAEAPRRPLPEEVDFEPEAVVHEPASGSATEPMPETMPDARPVTAAGPAPEPHAEPPLESPSEPPRPRRFESALLVNQSEFRRRDLARTLEALGLQVLVAEDLPTASRHVERGHVDLLVTDLRLGQDGGESFHTLRGRYPDLTIVLTSSVSAQYSGELARKTGAHRCWLDPYRKSDIEGLLRELTA
ncbi:MAG TPA: chemotaxis protein CheW [Candidatus Krumholzibacteria bacterium]|nr:chemotaxis protein CheW [Candidatus Krumholzibacteria bacterium]